MNPHLESVVFICEFIYIYIYQLVQRDTGHQAEADEGSLVIGDGEGSCEVSYALEGGYLKPGADMCLEDGEGVAVSVSCTEEEVVIGLHRGLRNGN